MARITVEDCLKQIPNRYQMVKLAAKRLRSDSRLNDESPPVGPDDDKPTVIALREIAAGNVTVKTLIVSILMRWKRNFRTASIRSED